MILEEPNEIIEAVNAELSESLARIAAAGEPERPADAAQDEFLELVIYGNKVLDVSNFLSEFYNSGSGVIRVRIDPLMTKLAMCEVFRYDLHERLKEALLACRAGYFIYRDGQWLNRHDVPFEMANVKVRGCALAQSQPEGRT